MNRAKKLAVAGGAVGALVGRKFESFSRELAFDTGHDEVLFAETTPRNIKRRG